MADRNGHPYIAAEAVSYSYGALKVLQDLQLEVKTGEIVVIVGPSGCGKTTLLNILSGYCKPNAGKVNKQGNVRTVYQQGSLFPWLTVSENIGIGLRGIKDVPQRNKEIDTLIELVNMQGFEHHYPYQLSGGMKQRAELGRVLAGESDIILMDEPFSALDYQLRLRMRKELIRLLQQRPKTVVLVTHDIDEAVQLADRVLILSKRPANICHQLYITVPHPRNSTHPELVSATATILEKLGLEN